MFASARRERSANRRTLVAALVVGGFAACIGNGPRPLHAQAPPPAPPCPTASVLLTAKPIFGVGLTTIRNACPAFLAALDSWYAAHPFATVADAVAAIRGTPPIIAPPPVVVQPPIVIPSGSVHYSDDFSTYTSTSDLLTRFWAGTNHDNGGVSGIGQPISYDLAERAMRYDWSARPTSTCSADWTIQLAPRWRLPAPTPNLWIRFTTKESPNFEHGRSGCGSAKSYKFFLVNLENGSTMGRAGMYLGDGNPLNQLSTRAYFDLNSPSALSGVQRGPDIGGDVSWGGSYHTWTIGLEGLGSDSTTFSTYLDGKLVHTIKQPFLAKLPIGVGWVVTFQMGANVNNGPDHSQSRWFREFGVYTSKPSGIP